MAPDETRRAAPLAAQRGTHQLDCRVGGSSRGSPPNPLPGSDHNQPLLEWFAVLSGSRREGASMKPLTRKRKGVGLESKTFVGNSGTTYLVFRSTGGSFHVFAEVEAKEAARDCGGKGSNTREEWRSIWKNQV